jgi:hypothetical protein
LYDAEIIRYAIQRTAMKFVKLNGAMDDLYLLKYASSIMNSETKAKGLQNV